MSGPQRLSPTTKTALSVVASEILAERRRQRRTARDLAERAGVSLPTLRKVEHGDPTVAVGTVFEIATLLGIPLVAATDAERALLEENARLRAAVLPARIQAPPPVDDDF